MRDCSLAIASGGVLAATAFARHWALQLLVMVAMAAVFWLLRTVPARRAYAVGASFTLEQGRWPCDQRASARLAG